MIIEPILDSIQLLDISDEEYFGERYKDYISNSRLKLINPEEGGSPELFKQGLSSNYSDSLWIGGAVHMMILQPAEYHIAQNVNRPTAKAGYMADELYPTFVRNGAVSISEIEKASNKIGYYKNKLTENRIEELKVKYADYFSQRKLYESKQLNSTPIYLDSVSRYTVTECIEAVNKSKQIQNLLHPKDYFEDPVIVNEGTLLMDVKVTVDNSHEVILKLKAKLDNFTFNKNDLTLVLNDLKTTGHMVNQFDDSFQKYHYYRQIGMYDWMLRQYIKKEYNKIPLSNTANMLVVSTIPQYYTKVYKVKESEVRKGFREFVKLLEKVAYCEVYGFN